MDLRKGLTQMKKQRGRVAVCGLLLLLALITSLFLRHVTTMLSSEQAAERWGGDAGSFAQISAYFPEHESLGPSASRDLPLAFARAIQEQGLNPLEPDASFAYAYATSAQLVRVASRDRGPIEVFATGVGGNFFLFQSVQLISGSFLPMESLNRDYVLIDQNLAWQLFGAVDVTGMELIIDGRPYIITGIYLPPSDFASSAAYGDRAHMFLFHDVVQTLSPGAGITSVQAVLPNPLTGLGEEIFRDAMDTANVNEDAFTLVNNSRRYTFLALVGVIREFGLRSMVQIGLRLPYWENAARISEDFAAASVLLLILLLLYPIWCVIRIIHFFWKRRKWRTRMVWDKAMEKREEHREEKWRNQQLDEIELDEAYDLEEIIRSVRESEEEKYDEKEL